MFSNLCVMYFGICSVTFVSCHLGCIQLPVFFRPKVQEVVVYSLLFTEAGQTLLGIIATGSDNVDQALVQQGRYRELKSLVNQTEDDYVCQN